MKTTTKKPNTTTYRLYSLRNEETSAQYASIGKTLISRYGIPKITEMWNKLGLGRPSTETTIKRWLSPGPLSKNANFEGFAVSLFHTPQQNKTPPLQHSIDKLQKHFDNDNIRDRRDRATSASLLAYYSVDKHLTHKQRELVDELLHRI